MKQTKLIMGMPITVEIVGDNNQKHIEAVFTYFQKIDNQYSTYKTDSEISKINSGLPKSRWSKDMRKVMDLCNETREQTNGYFDIEHDGKLDPSGLVKGWAIANAAEMLRSSGITNFYIEAGGDIQVEGNDHNNQPWKIGIRNPFNIEEIIKTVQLSSGGVATSGTYIRGEHIYDPHHPSTNPKYVKSLTIVGPNIYDADRFATAAFAMGVDGIKFISTLPDLEGYMVTNDKHATYTNGFERYVVNA